MPDHSFLSKLSKPPKPPNPAAPPETSDRQAGTRPLLGTILTLPDPRLAEICALAGCDWLFVDCEHGAIGTADLSRILTGAGEVPALVRIPDNEEHFVKRTLDSGCAGIICPQVHDARTAERIVAAAKYPPLGRRSVGIGRAHGYGLSFAGYMGAANDSTCVVIQIESRAGVENVDEIVAVPGVDGVFIGPYDLSASMGRPGELNDPEVRDAVRHVIDRCAAADMPVGQFFAGREAYLADPSRDSYAFAALGVDTAILANGVKSLVDGARGAR